MGASTAAGDPIKTIDLYDPDDGDDTHPARVCYLLPSDVTGVRKAILSWKILPFRSTTSLNPGTIGASTPTADASGSSGHTHTIPITGAVFANAVGWDGAGQNLKGTGGGNTGNINGESGHSHSHTHGSHTHSLTGPLNQAVTDQPPPYFNVTGIVIDGKDVTAALGGPWVGDIIELDISSVFRKELSTWHVIELDLDGLARVTSYLRIYYTT